MGKKDEFIEVLKERKAKETFENTYPGPPGIKLSPYEFDPKDLEKTAQQYANISAASDMKAAKKARTELKKQIAEIKRVHINNKKLINTFKKDVEAYDFDKFERLTVDLQSILAKIDNDISSIENGVVLRDREITEKIAGISNFVMSSILEANNTESIQTVLAQINQLSADPVEFDNRVGEVESLRTSLLLKASSRANEIQVAGGEIKQNKVKPLKDVDPGNIPMVPDNQRFSDTEIINFLQVNAIKGKGWAVTLSPTTGVAIYQVSDPKAPLSIREAIEIAIDNRKANSI